MNIGSIYQVKHSRKGNFDLLVISEDETWVTGIITNGKAGAMLAYNEVEQCDEITIRKSLCNFREKILE